MSVPKKRKTRGLIDQSYLNQANRLQGIAEEVLGVSPGNQSQYITSPILNVAANQNIDRNNNIVIFLIIAKKEVYFY